MENTLKGKYFIDDCMAYCLAHIDIVFCFLFWCKNVEKHLLLWKMKKWINLKIIFFWWWEQNDNKKNVCKRSLNLMSFSLDSLWSYEYYPFQLLLELIAIKINWRQIEILFPKQKVLFFLLKYLNSLSTLLNSDTHT